MHPMSQDRLSGLSILSIDGEQAKNFDLSEIVKQFAEKNPQDAESDFITPSDTTL